MSCRAFNVALLVALSIITSSCATTNKETDLATYHDSAYDDRNRAPSSMRPPLDGKEKGLDAIQVRTQADYNFAVGEAQSYEGQHNKAIESFKAVLVYDQNSPQVYLRIAAEYLKLGMMSQSLEYAQLAVIKNPKYVEAKLLIGGLYTTLKEYDKALASYNDVLKIHPSNTEAPMYIGAVYAEMKQYDKAVTYFEALVKNDEFSTPHLSYYYIGRIRTEQQGKNYKKAAEQAYLKALDLKPDHTESVLALSNLYLKLQQQPKAVTLLKTFQKERGPNVRVAESLSQMYLENEEYDLAYSQLEIMESASEDSLGIKVRMALILIEQKKLKPAILKLNEILAMAPESDKIRFYLAAVYEESGQLQKATEQFKKISPESQFYTDSIVHASYLLKQSKKIDEAAQVVSKAIEIRPDIPQFYAVYASVLDEKGDFKLATEYLKKGIARFPDNVQLHFFLGTVSDRLGEKKVVVDQMKRVISLDPNHVQGLNYLAYTYSEMNENLNEAETLIKKAISLDPKDGYVLDTYGWILYKQGKMNESIKVLESAYKVQPTESVIAEHLGDAYYKSQMVERARYMYEKAVEFESDAQKVKSIRLKITAIENQELQKKDRLPASSPSTGN